MILKKHSRCSWRVFVSGKHMHWHALCAVTLEWRWTRVWAKPEDCHSLTCILYHWLTCCLFSSHVCQVSWLQPPCQFDKTLLFIHHSQCIYLLSANDSVGSVDQLGGNSKLNHPQALREKKNYLAPKKWYTNCFLVRLRRSNGCNGTFSSTSKVRKLNTEVWHTGPQHPSRVSSGSKTLGTFSCDKLTVMVDIEFSIEFTSRAQDKGS